MFNRTFDSLGGTEVLGSVGEPWDFESDAGPNVIAGKVEAVSPAADSSGWILCRVKPFVHSGGAVDQVVAVLRYRSTDNFGDLCAGKRIGVNFVFEPGLALATEGDVVRLLTRPGHPFLAGSLQLRQGASSD